MEEKINKTSRTGYITKYIKPIIMVLVMFFIIVINAYNADTDTKGSVVKHNKGNNEAISSNNIRVIDGDTIVLDGKKVRLKGIDAPEIKQECTSNTNGKEVKTKCGEIAKQKLINIVNSETKVTGKNKVRCTGEGKDRYNRQVSYCYIGETNINREMVREGYAVACSRYNKSFVLDELYAKELKKGIWGGKFEKPEEWRRNRKKKRVYWKQRGQDKVKSNQ